MTSLAPLFAAPPVIQAHALAALLALVLGPFAIHRQRRDRMHKVIGYTWITAMAATALTSFWIHSMPVIGPFGPIHALSALTLISLFLGLRAAIRGNLVEHRRTFRSLYYYGVGAAGIFTLLPGRIMHRVVFGEDTQAGFVLIALLLGAGLVARLWQRGKGAPRNA